MFEQSGTFKNEFIKLGIPAEDYDILYTVSSWFRQCIPFDGNEHLLGKTEDCDDFYKPWE